MDLKTSIHTLGEGLYLFSFLKLDAVKYGENSVSAESLLLDPVFGLGSDTPSPCTHLLGESQNTLVLL